jgi:hypothetical protein
VKNAIFWDVTPCGLVRTEVSEDRITSIIRVTKIGKLGTMLAVTSNQSTLQKKNTMSHRHSHHCENLKSYIRPLWFSRNLFDVFYMAAQSQHFIHRLSVWTLQTLSFIYGQKIQLVKLLLMINYWKAWLDTSTENFVTSSLQFHVHKCSENLICLFKGSSLFISHTRARARTHTQINVWKFSS